MAASVQYSNPQHTVLAAHHEIAFMPQLCNVLQLLLDGCFSRAVNSTVLAAHHEIAFMPHMCNVIPLLCKVIALFF